MDTVVAQLHEAAGIGVFFRGERQVAIARDELATLAEHLVIDVVGLIGTQDLARGDRQLQRHAPVHLAQLLAEHDGARFQRAVVRCIRDRLGHKVRHRNAHRPEQQQRREHPVENLAEQRSGDGPGGGVFEMGEGIGEVAVVSLGCNAGARCARDPVATPRPGQPISHGQWQGWRGRQRAPGNSPTRARWQCGCHPPQSSCASGGRTPRWRCC